MNFYEILGVGMTASNSEIAAAFRKLAIKHHPDKNPNNLEEAEKKYKEISSAYATLSDPEKRARYNLTLSKATPAKKPVVKKKPPSHLKPEDQMAWIRANDPNSGNIQHGRAPKFDIWGNPLTAEERRQWELEASSPAIQSPKKPKPKIHPHNKPTEPVNKAKRKEPKGFVDQFAKYYDRGDQPNIRGK